MHCDEKQNTGGNWRHADNCEKPIDLSPAKRTMVAKITYDVQKSLFMLNNSRKNKRLSRVTFTQLDNFTRLTASL